MSESNCVSAHLFSHVTSGNKNFLPDIVIAVFTTFFHLAHYTRSVAIENNLFNLENRSVRVRCVDEETR